MSAAAEVTKSKKVKAQPIQAVPEEVVAPTEYVYRAKPGAPEGMYPEGVELFSYTPKSTGDTIWFPMTFQQPSFEAVWELSDKQFHVQSWAWMRWADIPKAMQRKAVKLMDEHPDEYLDLFEKWFKAMGGATPGE